MSSNKPVPQSPSKAAKFPDYTGLVRFLVQPFLESPDSLSVDCEIFPTTARIWIRLAFEGEDKGRVFGRGGRNIQSIRTVLAAAAALAGYSVYLEIYGSQSITGMSESEDIRNRSERTSRQSRGTTPKSPIKLRSQSSSE